MRSQTRLQRLTASPVLVGALTTLIVIVAVFLAYNANTGLPFVPTYRVSAEVPNANALVEGNEVRVGGVRVGTVETIKPLPRDSTFIIRTRSALGLKFLEITPGEADRGLPEGGTLGLDAARPEP